MLQFSDARYCLDKKCHNKIPPVTLTFNESTPACVDFSLSSSTSPSPPAAIPPPGILTNPVHARDTSVRNPRPFHGTEKNADVSGIMN